MSHTLPKYFVLQYQGCQIGTAWPLQENFTPCQRGEAVESATTRLGKMSIVPKATAMIV